MWTNRCRRGGPPPPVGIAIYDVPPSASPTPNLVIVEEAVPKGNPTPIISSPYPTSSPILIGQHADVGVRETHGRAITNIMWTIQNAPIANFVESAAANPVQTLSPTALTSPDVSFFWTAPDATTYLLVTASVGDGHYEAITSYNVLGMQAVTLAGTYGTIGLDATYDKCLSYGEWLHIGSPCGTEPPGMQFNFSATEASPAPVGGTINMIQTATWDNIGQPTPYPTGTAGTPPNKTITFTNYLDNEAPYENNPDIKISPGGTAKYNSTSVDNDSPADGFGTPPPDCLGAQINEQFVSTMIFHPTATSARTSIPVGIGSWMWSWQAAGTYSNGTWSLSGAAPGSGSSSTAYTMPDWVGTFANGGSPC